MTDGSRGERIILVNLLVVIIVGAVIGWLASQIMKTQQGLAVDIIVGVVGALLASYLFGKETFTSGNFAITSLLWSLFGAVILLAALKLLLKVLRR